jgi:hypothetical protein
MKNDDTTMPAPLPAREPNAPLPERESSVPLPGAKVEERAVKPISERSSTEEEDAWLIQERTKLALAAGGGWGWTHDLAQFFRDREERRLKSAKVVAEAKGRREAFEEILRRHHSQDGDEFAMTFIQWVTQQRDACGTGAKAGEKPADCHACEQSVPALAVEPNAPLPAIGEEVEVHIGGPSWIRTTVTSFEEPDECGQGPSFVVRQWAGHWHACDEGKKWRRVPKDGKPEPPLSEAELREEVADFLRNAKKTVLDLAVSVATAQRAKVRSAKLPTKEELAEAILPRISACVSLETCSRECAEAVLTLLGAQSAGKAGVESAAAALPAVGEAVEVRIAGEGFDNSIAL